MEPGPDRARRDAERLARLFGGQVGPGDQQQHVAFGGGQLGQRRRQPGTVRQLTGDPVGVVLAALLDTGPGQRAVLPDLGPGTAR